MSPEDHFKVLALVALADDHVDTNEQEMLVRCAAWLGLTRQRAGEILTKLQRDGGVTGLVPPTDPAERQGLFNAIVNVVIADGQVTVSEQASVMSMAKSFGIDPRTVPGILSRAIGGNKTSRVWPSGWHRSPQRHTSGFGPAPVAAPTPAAPAPATLELGATIGGRFRLDKLLGEGGFGKVFQARHLDLEEDVALKVLLPSVAQSDEGRKRFLREVKVCRSFVHRYSMTLREFGRDADTGSMYFTMDLVPGETLEDLLAREGPQPVERMVPLFGQVLEVLSEAHRIGLVHRDLKPANLMITQGADGSEEVRVLDFGIAKAVAAAGETELGKLTQDGGIIGTLDYMSPEQASGADLDPRSDLYSLAVVLYESLSGTLPYKLDAKPGARKQSILYQIIMEPPRELIDVLPDSVPETLSKVLHRCLDKEPAERHADALAMRDALAAAVADSGEDDGLLSRWLRALKGED